MKRYPSIPLAWGGALLIALLLVLAIAVLVAGRSIERAAASLETDAVPGLIQSNAIRTAFSEGFFCSLRAADDDTPAGREAFLRQRAEADRKATVAGAEYQRSIRIDPVHDTANYEAMLKARDEFLPTRDEFIRLVEADRRAAAQQLLLQQMTPRYERLMRACDVLVDYNNRTGTTISARMIASLAALRWVVVAVVILALIAGLSVGTNLTQRLRMERALRESESKFSTAFQFSPHSMVISRRSDGRIIAANETFKRLYDLSDQEVTGKTSFDVGVWSDVVDREALLRQMSRDGLVRNFVKERIAPDGRKLTGLVSAKEIMIGGEACILSVGQDITDRINAEQALARSVEELRVIFQNAGIGMALVDSTGRIIRCNPSLERFLGYSGDELCTRSIAQVTHPDDVGRDLSLFEKLVRGEIAFYQVEKRYLRQDGATVWGHLTVSAVFGTEGQLAYGIGMVEDVTEQKQAELALGKSESARQALQEQLIVAQKLEAVGQLAGGVAHDFNNFLAAILLYLDLLKSEAAIAPGMQESLGELGKAARRAAGLTRQLLLFSRREPAQRQVVDFNAIVSNLLKMLDRLVGEHFTLVHEGAGPPRWLHADPGMMEQVVMNLVVNARDAMPRGGRIGLRLEDIEVDAARAQRQLDGRVGRFVRLTVSDTGCGMSAATQARIFEPFFTTKEAGKGTGLGLSTVFGIVQQHAGWITVQSEEGQGSSFAVYLPAHFGPADEGPRDQPVVLAARGHETILLAEDNEPVRAATARILRQGGYRVLEAADGRAAQDLLEGNSDVVDLLLTDVVMPGGLLGHELAAGLASGRRRPKVILMSGHNLQVDLATLDGAAGVYLAKPFDADRLLRVVRSTLDHAPVPI